MKNALVRRVSR